MKKYLFILLVSVFGKLASQNNDCVNAILLCSTPNFTFNATANDGNVNELPGPGSNPVSNPGTNVETFNNNQGCLLQGENNPQWLLISVGNAGLLEFVFGAGNSANTQAGFYDWAMWPYTGATCSGIINNTLPPIRCNWNASNAGGTGLASIATIANINATAPATAQAVAGNFQTPLQVNACDQFIICISNFSNVNTLVNFLSLGTASLSCSPNCASYNLCAGSNATITPVNFANLSNPTFSLNPGGLTNNTGVFVVSPLVTTNYTTYITGLNGLNSVQTITSVTGVVVNPQPIIAPTFTQSTCTNTLNGLNLHLTFNPPTPAPTYTVSWNSIPNGITSATQFSITGGVGAGVYIPTVTAAGGCQAIATITINATPAPANYTLTPLGGNFSITCAQPQIVVMATQPSFNYTWTNGAQQPSNDPDILVNNTNLGTYTITGVNPVSGCSATHTFNVGQNFVAPTSAISPTFQNITCLIDPITVSVTASPTANITHNFISPNGPTVSINSYTAIFIPGVGIYTHCVVNNVNGCSTCKEFTVASNDNFPSLTVSSANNYTVGCGSHSTAAVNIAGDTNPNQGGNVTYTILAPGTGTSYGFASIQQYSLTTPGTYTAIVKDGNNGCQTKVPFSIIQDIAGPNIDADVPVDILSCNTPSMILTAITSNTLVNFSWSFPGPSGGTVAVVNPTVAVQTSTNVQSPLVATYTLSIQNLVNGCFSTLPVPVKQNLYPPKAGISSGLSFSVSCNTQSVSLSNTSTTGIPPATGYPTNSIVAAYLWEGPPPQSTVQLAANYIAYVPGIYTLTAKDFNNGCTSQTTTTIGDNRLYPVVNTPAPPSATLDCGVISKKISVSITGDKTKLGYNWLPPVNSGSVSGVNSDSLRVFQTGNYRVIVTNTTNGCATLGSIDVVAGVLDAAFAPDYTSGYAPLTVTFINNSHSSGGSTSSITTVWSFGNGTQSTTTLAATPATAIYSQPGTYTVTQYASKGQCQDTAMRLIRVDIPSKLEIPNVFTPNGDGTNDLLFLKVANLDEITASIFDRWGHKVYELTSTTGNIAWDGKTETGKEAAAGVYFYIIKATGKDGRSYDTKGTVTLYR